MAFYEYKVKINKLGVKRMKIWRWSALVFTAVLLLLTGCGSSQVTGNGKTATKMRVVQRFDEIAISGAYKVEVTQGNSESIKITTDSNIIPLVITKVEDGKLSIHNKKGVSFSLTRPVLIQIVIRKLKQINVSGSNELIVANLNLGSLAVNTNGSVQAALSGRAGKLSMQISGSGSVNAGQLVAKVVKVRMMGSGEIVVNATHVLDTKITGSGTVKYSGNPDDVDQSIIGNGTLERIK
jgi:hypothetical protein